MNSSPQIKAAIAYPFSENNWKNVLLIPTLVVYGYFILSFILNTCLMIVGFIAILVLGLANGFESATSEALQGIIWTFFQGIGGLIGFLVSIVLESLKYGYLWHMIGQLRTQGYDAQAPVWDTTAWIRYGVDGIKLYGYYLILTIAVTLLVTLCFGLAFLYGQFVLALPAETLGLLLGGMALAMALIIFLFIPFGMAPMYMDNPNKSFLRLLNLAEIITFTLPRYGRVMLTLVLWFFLVLAYAVCSLLLALTCVGILLLPAFSCAMTVTFSHLLAQAYGRQPPSPSIQVISPA